MKNLPASDADDAELVSQLHAGDEGAVARFYDRFAPQLFSMLSRILAEPGEAEAALEHALGQIVKGLPTSDPRRSSLFTWAVMIARQAGLARLRRMVPPPSHRVQPANDGTLATRAFFGEVTELTAAGVGEQLRRELLARRTSPQPALNLSRQIEEQACLYVFGLLHKAAASGFERQLESDEAIRLLVDQLDESAATIALEAPAQELPPQLRATMIEKLGRRPKAVFSSRASWIAWLIAVAFGLSCGYLVAERDRLRKRVTHLEQRDLISEIQIIILAPQPGAPAGATGVVVWDGRKQRGLARIACLPQSAPDQQYHLWITDSRYKSPVSGGTFRLPDNDALTFVFQPAAPIRKVEQFTIQLESSIAPKAATNPIILLLGR